MTSTCSVYGLGLRVNRPLAGLGGLAPPANVDVTVSLGSMPPELDGVPALDAQPYYLSDDKDEHERPSLTIERVLGGKFFLCVYADGTTIAIDQSGSTVWATWRHPATIEDAATYLLGPTLGLVLRLRGVVCLHASAVNIGGKAILLAGPSGAGKSSMAAAFVQRGRSVLTEDVAALAEQGGSFEVQAGYPRVRLWSPSVHGLFGAPDALPLLTTTWDKRFLDLSGANAGFQPQPLPVGGIYLLGPRSTEPRLQRLAEREAMVQLVANTYANHLLTPAMRAHEFDVLARLVRIAPVYMLHPVDDLAAIGRLCQLIEDNSLQGSSRGATSSLSRADVI